MGLTEREAADLAERLGTALLEAGRRVATAKAAGSTELAEYQAAVAAEAEASHELFDRLPDRIAREAIGKVEAVLQTELPPKWLR